MRGNAKDWIHTAPRLGFKVDTVPVVGAVFVKTSGYYGHVGVVTQVLSGGRFRTNEMNGGRLLASPPHEYGKTTQFGRFAGHVRFAGPEMRFIYRPGTEPGQLAPQPQPQPQQPGSQPTPFQPQPEPNPPQPVPAPERVRADAYGNYGSATAGHAMCRGNPGVPDSMPGGTARQTFTVPTGVASIDSAMVQIDPDLRVTAHATLVVNGATLATSTAAATGDTRFAFAAVPVRAGDQAALSIRFSASFGKIITVYTAAVVDGTFTASNSCPAGAPNVTRANGLRAVITGWSR